MNKTAESAWKECLIFIKDNLQPQAYKTWFEPVIPIKLENDTLTIQVPSKFFHEWIEEHYLKLLRVALIKFIGEKAKLNYQIRVDYTYSSLNITNVEKSLEYDVFISHSSEDKDSFVRPLVIELQQLGIRVWYDEFELKLGDSLRKSIDKGLINSRYGIIILSKSFFNRNWTQYELNGFVNREMNGLKVILPIWHNVTKEEVQNFSPSLADKVALNSELKDINGIANDIYTFLTKTD
ncbi:TIR protein [Allomuricauda ruestringensis DSM 13258]|uniref:ADP-ribosyl cyclase/cyclic ADP-ribose hydrolase n=1 Tax=Allomuricauda ruestringensis (strain DSM 13258 / CIP 107369 / LMG 19739 / B1) TaxID=886377 RepID=G2PKW7_ALLRU|nr:toll/interleukin-1 receptor domain-containing protein [Allomuricauda ruestringensis]AEM69946.1 TIR protein [Allomuricauda ruestringensis DSM 13258]